IVLLLILNCVNVRRCLFNLYLHLTLAPRQMFRRTNQKTLMGKTRGIKNLIGEKQCLLGGVLTSAVLAFYLGECLHRLYSEEFYATIRVFISEPFFNEFD